MTNQKAVIFDMDGVIVDSENLWKQAEKEIFSSFGAIVTEEYSAITESMTTAEVTRFWFDKFPWEGEKLETVEQMVVSRVIELIETKDCEIDGVKAFIEKLKYHNFKIGLATNSPNRIIRSVLKKVDILNLFDTITSAEFECKGKPDPSIYITTAAKLNVTAHNCTVIEDSYSGIFAAKNAGMKVIAFTNGFQNRNIELTDYTIESFKNIDMDLFN